MKVDACKIKNGEKLSSHYIWILSFFSPNLQLLLNSYKIIKVQLIILIISLSQQNCLNIIYTVISITGYKGTEKNIVHLKKILYIC